MKVARTIPTMPASWYFETREEAGRRLAGELAPRYPGARAVVLAIPRGGVPVGMPIALALDAPLDVTVVRKIPIPWEPEAGLGAVTDDGTIVLNEELMPLLGLSEGDLEREARAVQAEIRRRAELYRCRRPAPELAGKLVVLTDDGLATGYTMVAAMRSVRKSAPRQVVVAVPVAPRSSLERIEPEADEVICLVEQERGPFAVASFYRQFPELGDAQVLEDLQQVQRIEPGNPICASVHP